MKKKTLFVVKEYDETFTQNFQQFLFVRFMVEITRKSNQNV